MNPRGIGEHATPRCAHQQTLLQQKRLHHGLERGGVLTQCSGQGLKAHRPAPVLFHQKGQQTPVSGIQATVIDAMHAQGLGHQIGINPLVLSLNRRHIAHPTQQTVGDARGSAT
ncbi:MAG: Uncharacterised protein [Synechococcus sp. CC9902]|nr:MAG: Uncharacterised protein [Synechococcus sp. CC9902]